MNRSERLGVTPRVRIPEPRNDAFPRESRATLHYAQEALLRVTSAEHKAVLEPTLATNPELQFLLSSSALKKIDAVLQDKNVLMLDAHFARPGYGAQEQQTLQYIFVESYDEEERQYIWSLVALTDIETPLYGLTSVISDDELERKLQQQAFERLQRENAFEQQYLQRWGGDENAFSRLAFQAVQQPKS